MKRHLALRREPLTELTTGDLTMVAGAAVDPSVGSCPVAKCVDMVEQLLTGACYTRPCPSAGAC